MNIPFIPLIAIFCTGILNASAGILLKTSILNRSTEIELYIYVALALLLYGLAFIFYYIALKKLSIAVAYSLTTAFTISILTIYSIIFFNKLITLTMVLGLIMLPIAVMLLLQGD